MFHTKTYKKYYEVKDFEGKTRKFLIEIIDKEGTLIQVQETYRVIYEIRRTKLPIGCGTRYIPVSSTQYQDIEYHELMNTYLEDIENYLKEEKTPVDKDTILKKWAES